MPWILDTRQGRITVKDATRLRARLARLEEACRAAPEIVILNAPDGACLYIGLGLRLAALGWIAPGGWPARHVAGSDDSGEILVYNCTGRCSEIPASQAVPVGQAIAATMEFFDSGRLSEELDWEDD